MSSGNLSSVALAAISRAVASAVATALQNNPGNNAPPPAHVLLERFQKQKPESFRDAATPIDAENWIAHLEKIFDALGTPEDQKVRLATYKLEGDAQRWWKALKEAQGDGYADALAWPDFLNVFYDQYFSVAEREAYRREYLSIRQKDSETITAYMVRFIRLAGIAGAVAGTAAEQAKHFRWGLLFEFRRQLMNNTFGTVADVANAARNLEIERADYNSYRSGLSRKRDRDDQDGSSSDRRGRFQSGNQYTGGRDRDSRYGNNGYHQADQHKSRHQNQVQNQDQTPVCTTCGKRHFGVCRRASGACFRCGKTGHQVKDCPHSDTKGKNGGDANQPTHSVTPRPMAESSGRVECEYRLLVAHGF